MAHSPMVFVVGILGNIASFVSFLAPVQTFYRVCKKKSTEGFQSIPYVAALFSAMLWIFYAYIKTGEFLIITINAFGCVIETIYLTIYILYCPKKARIFTLRMLLLLNLFGISTIVFLVHILKKERAERLELLGWICVILSICVYAAPLSIIKVVIRTKSVEFMPFTLSLLLTISAILWMMYGILLRDIYVTLPNIVGITFGTIQMVLYAIYRKNKPVHDQKLPERKGDIINHDNTVTTVIDGDKQEVTPQQGDIEIGENKKDVKQEQQQEENEKQDQLVALNQTQPNNNKTEEV